MVALENHSLGMAEHFRKMQAPMPKVRPSVPPAVQEVVPANVLDNKSNGTGGEVQGMIVNVDGFHPNESVQQWYAHERRRILLQNPHLARSHMSVGVSLQGPFQREALQIALDTLMNHHEILRTTFSVGGGSLTELVHPFKVKELNVIDLLHHEEAVLKWMEEDLVMKFDLENETAWRVSLYRLGGERHILFIVMNCIISDSRSPRLLLQELATLYSASLQQQGPLQREPVSLQYQYLVNCGSTNDEILEQQRQLRSFANELRTSRPVELPCDKPRPAALSGRVVKQRFEIGPVLYEELQKFCGQSNADMFVVLIAAFRAAHYRLTGSEDATLGFVDESRQANERKNNIGPVVNLQLVRSIVEGKSFRELVSHVQTAMTASSHSQGLPFELIASELQKTRDTSHLSRHPIIQVALFMHHEMHIDEYAFEDTQAQVMDFPISSGLDIELHLHQKDGILVGEAIFSKDLYYSETICHMLSIFKTTLEQGVKQPDTTVASLPLLTDTALLMLRDLDLIRMHESDYPRECSVTDLFSQQVDKCPDAVAVKDASGQLTYRQLDHQSDIVSWWLSNRSFAPETVIAVLAIRSCETIIAFLGILKANMAYLPLDANQPEGRLEKVLSSFEGRRLVLCSHGVRRPKIKQDVAEFISITDVILEQAIKHGQVTRASSTSLALVMFTSGSTAEPKGVMIEHRAIVRLVQNSNVVQHMDVKGATAHLSNIAFDASTWEIYAALLNGGTLVCIDAMAVLHPHTLEEIIAREHIQNALLTTALFKEYIVSNPRIFCALRAIYVGGEKVDPEDFVTAQQLTRGKLLHAYGPTENTVMSTIFSAPGTETYANGVPLGPPVSNSGAYVMDSQLRLVPLGVMGELVVTGDGLARGYTDSRLNAGRFVSVEIDAKLIRAYRTGDYVRRRPGDGLLEFIGRIDGQIKLRGHRIELGEIEQALRGCALVQDAAVLVSQETEQDQRDLVGFVTLGEVAAQSEDDKKQQQVGALEENQVGGWGTLFNADKYVVLDHTKKDKLGRDFTGWTSMYDGKIIDVTEMDEWLDDTIAAIRDGGPPHAVLEIGTGTGMILFNIVEGLTSYVGLDPAQRAVDFVRTMAQSIPALADKIRVQLGTATDIKELGELNSPNLVIVNSVVQYFPSLDYLSSVVQDLLHLEGTERLFFGDIRSFALYRDFQASTILHRVGGAATMTQMLEQMAQIERSEEELLIDPAFFTALAKQFPDLVEHVEILPKKMRARNELSCYRYSAVVHVKRHGQQLQIREVPEQDWIDFMARKLDYPLLLDILTSRSHDPTALVAVSNIPNSKTILERCVVDALDGDMASIPQDDWYAFVKEKAQSCPSLSTTDLIGLAKLSGFRVEMSWARQYSQRGGLDAVFHRFRPAEGQSRVKFRFPTETHGNPSHSLGTQPLWLRLSRKVEKDLHEVIKSQLPSYMVPKLIRVLKKMPINRNGKLDRQALAREIKMSELSRAQNIQAPPRNDLERVICEEFARVLGTTVGIHDDFFEHGGHSLIATRAASRINTQLSANMTVKDIFDCPTVAALADRIGTSTDSCRYVPIPRNESAEPVEQSFAQRRLWFLQLLYPTSTWYLVPFAVRLRGPLDCDALTASLRALEERHETLRTTFGQQDGVAIQIVQPFQPKKLEVIDMTTEKGEASLREFLHQEQTKPFDLERETGWRVKLCRLNEDHHVLSIVMHHIISDGWSIDVLQRELAEFYSAARRAENLQLEVKQLPVRYQDYATWQKREDQAEEHQKQLEYWVKHLDESRPAELFGDLRRPASLSGRAATREFEIAGSLYNDLIKFCKARPRITPFIVLLAAFRATHFRLTGSADATIGTPIANRNRQELEEIIGFFVNIQCMRIKIDDESFEDLVQNVQSTATSAFANQDVPFETIVSRLQTNRDASRNPLVQIMFALHSQLDLGHFKLPDIQSEPLSSSVASRFDLECHIFQEKQSLQGRVVFSTDLYQPQTIENLTRTFHHLLERGIHEPETKIRVLPLLTPDCQAKLERMGLLGINRCNYPRDSSVVDVFRHRVAANPRKIAVKDSKTSLTYAELDRQSDRLCCWLSRRSLAPETLVGVYATRCPRTIVTFLGILKANLGYLPLDVKLPPRRIESILSALEGKLLILVGDGLDLPTIERGNVDLVLVSDIFLNDETLETASISETATLTPTASSIAYVMFTSGSTGRPKGVVIEHRGIVRLATQQESALKRLDAKKNMAHVSNIAFDASTWEIYTSLLNGGTLVCVDDVAAMDAKALTKIYTRDNVQNAFFTPALLQEYVQHPQLLRTLHTVCTGGELCDSAVFNAALGLVSGAVIHCYGPTEDTCMSTAYCPEEEIVTDRVPVGRSVNNSGAYVMDSNLQPVPIGIVGELVLVGDGLARGYTSPELNTNRFVSVTVDGQPARAYRTGDYARYRPVDGQLDFLGRMDGQVKIRGHRVELAEIEQVLRKHDNVDDAVAVLQQRQRDEGIHRLAAFVTTRNIEPQIDVQPLALHETEISQREMPHLHDELFIMLRATFPSYMVPGSIQILDKLPINENGKVNRKALANAVHKPVVSKASKRQPTLEVERKMQRIWAGVLKIEPELIGLDDNFFWIGGDSISAMRVVAAARKNGLALSVGDIFTDSRLSQVSEKAIPLTGCSSEYIAPFALVCDEPGIPSLIKEISSQCRGDAPIQDAFPCTPLQEGFMSLSWKQGGYMMQAVLKLSLNVAISSFRSAWETVVRAYPILRTRIVNHNSLGLLQVVLDEDIQWVDSSALDEYIDADRTTLMGVGEPLVRFALVRDELRVHKWFVLTIHHALYDGWSMSLILDAVNKAYHGESINAPAQHQLFIRHALSQQSVETREYWRKLMEGYEMVPFPALPVSVRQPLAQQAITHRFERRGDCNTDITTASLLRAAWALVSGHMTNSSDVVFGATVFGRNAPVTDIDQMPAPTIATVPVRVKFTGSQKVSDYLKSVQQDASKMIPFEQMGLHRIAKISSETRQACSFQTLVVIHLQSHASESDALGTWEDGNQERWFNTHALVLDMNMVGKQISVKANFDSTVIEQWVVHALLVRLEHVVQQLQTAPEKTLDEIEVASPKDLEQLWKWNSAVPKATKSCIHNMIEKTVEHRPHAQAVCAWDGEFTYAELDRLATVLARRLSSLRVRPGAIVPLCFEKSRWTVVGMLAVLKAGAGFVLLDTSQPMSRLRSIIDQIRSRLVVSSTAQAASCASLAEVILPIGPAYFHNAAKVAAPFSPAVSPQPSSAMYLVFTSGSTGRPKGVVITHEAFCSAVTHQSELFGYCTTTRAFDFSSYMFDVSLLSTFTTLAVGGCLCVPSNSDRTENLTESLLSMKANLVDLTPSVARTLHREKLSNLKTLVLGGEVVRSDDVTGWPNGVRVITSYGPAECTPSATINQHSLEPGNQISIGFGAGAVTWVTGVVDHNKLAPVGAVGELVLEGPIVGDGYLNDPDRTEAAFVKDPDWLLRGWTSHPGRRGRLYKTGDLVRYNEDGSLVFVGRKDTQVKMRGQRVELGDVEQHIQQCIPSMNQVVVEAISPAEDDSSPSLVAFVCMEPSKDHTSSNGGKECSFIQNIDIGNDARSKLVEQLPSYMMPVAFLRLSTLPSTASGKVDRRRLHDIGRSFFAGEIEVPEADSPESCNETCDDGKIGEDEEIAYKLAQKMFSLIPAWNQNAQHPEEKEAKSLAIQFDNVLLYAAGLDSVNMMSIIAFIMYEFGVRISMQVMMDRSTTIRSLALLVSEAKTAAVNGDVESPAAGNTAPVDLIAQIDKHDARIATSQALVESYSRGENGLHHPKASKLTSVFLTGSNGFIGIEILRQLLGHRQISQVTALVRGKSPEAARNRLISAAKKALWWTDLHEDKLQIWQGDLSLPNLGLDPSRWSSLKSGSVADVIVHNGADVHFAKSYAMLESTNVLSTLELLDMVVNSQHMRFVYVGGGLLTSENKTEVEVVRDLSSTDSNGYAQTKFVAEALVRRAAARSIPDTNRLGVVRPGVVIGTSTEGVTNSGDYIWRLTASCIRTGVYNDAEADQWVPVSDVSATAMRIISAALDSTSGMTPVVQLHDGMKFGEFWAILKAMGYMLIPKSRAEWLAIIRKDINCCGETHPLWPLAHALESHVTWVADDYSDVEKKCRETPFGLKVAVWKSVEFLKREGATGF